MTARMLLAISVAAITLMGAGASARADVRIDQLTADAIQAEFPAAAQYGIVPGDVVLRNDVIRVVVATVTGEKDRGRAAQCLIFPTDLASKAAPVRYIPGPAGAWRDVEAGKVASVAVLRFHRPEERWNAELVYKLHDGSSWLDVTTIVRNQDSKEILEIPVVDELSTISGAKLDNGDDRKVFVVQPEGNAAVGYLSLDRVLNARQTSGGHWSLGLVSGDEEDRSLLPVGLKFWGKRKREHLDTYNPVAAARTWHRSQRDDDDWHRLKPGEERAIDRRLIPGNDLTEAKTIAEAVASEKSPLVQLVPSGGPEGAISGNSRPNSKIVGQLRTAAKPASVLTAASEPEPTMPATKPSNVQVHPESDAETLETVPAILDPTIEAIEDLPPPIDE